VLPGGGGESGKGLVGAIDVRLGPTAYPAGLGYYIYDTHAHALAAFQADWAESRRIAIETRPNYLTPMSDQAFCSAGPEDSVHCAAEDGAVVIGWDATIAKQQHYDDSDLVLQAAVDNLREIRAGS
jgi:hypothetical protein